jgi:hypothetical protein
VDERAERIAGGFERPLLVAAVLTIPVTILQLLPPADPWRTLPSSSNSPSSTSQGQRNT